MNYLGNGEEKEKDLPSLDCSWERKWNEILIIIMCGQT